MVRVEKIALDAVEIAGRLVAYDGRTAGVAINFILPENHDQAVIEITDYLNSVLAEARANHPAIDYYMTGDVVMNRTFADVTQSDIQTPWTTYCVCHHRRCHHYFSCVRFSALWPLSPCWCL